MAAINRLSPALGAEVFGLDASRPFDAATVTRLRAAFQEPAHDPRVIFQRNNARWHTDSSYRFVPSLASILYRIEVLPDGAAGGETGFSNMFLAYDALPEDMKRRLEPLHMVHSYEGIRRLEPEMPPTTASERDAFPPVTHPLIRVHPDRDGRRSLYFTCNTAREIGGGTLEEGQALHEWLREHVSQPRLCYARPKPKWTVPRTRAVTVTLTGDRLLARA